ncbi:MAG: hypothetical protein SA378_05275 [Sedimentibacter sp.]|uniref:hypothetical protein n=1 Tax=Sedimentibacter sp. TaxID=1960295 RepID=UPI0029817793|nr:hypothetical protein [Sedimentibacter sp.]MDW5299533.1 hypothetical protein [Sedimentibacter sp.]
MRFRFTNLRKVKLPATLYCLEYYYEPTDKDIKSLENSLDYAQKKNPHISWFVAVSDTDSKTAVKYYDKTGKRGRPKIKVDGTKIKRHLHIGIMGNEEKSAYSVAKGIGNSINKRIGKKCTKIVAMKGAGFITYSYQQANTFHTGGDFDFSQCKDDFYIEE